MTFVSLFHLLVFMGYLLENGSTAESSPTQASCTFNATLRNNPAITCLLLNLTCNKPMFVENCGYINDSACSLDWCSTDCCLKRSGYNGLDGWPRSLNPPLHDCWRMPVCHTNAYSGIHAYFVWPWPIDVYQCSASYQCILVECSSYYWGARGAYYDLLSKYIHVFTCKAEIPRRNTVSSTTRSTTTDLKSEKPATLFRGSRKTTDITLSDQEKEVSSVIKRRIDSDVSTKTYTTVSDTDSSLVAAVVVPIVLVALAVGAGVPLLLWKRRRYGKSIRAIKSNKEIISAQHKPSSRNTETRGLQSTEVTACASGVQNNRECHDGIKAVENQGYSCAILEEGFKHEDQPYFILEPQGNEHSQVPTSHFKTSTASEYEENEYNRIQFTKPNVILDDNYGEVSYKSSTSPVNADEAYSHLGDDAETFRNAMDYSHIRLVKKGKPDDKGDYSNLYIER